MIVYGQTIDDQTRCVHYGTPADVVAIKFFCCRRYYPCHRCHEDSAGHPAAPAFLLRDLTASGTRRGDRTRLSLPELRSTL